MILCEKSNVKFTGREQVTEWLDHLQNFKIINQYDKNIPRRYNSDYGVCQGMRTGHPNGRVQMDKMEKLWLFRDKKMKRSGNSNEKTG